MIVYPNNTTAAQLMNHYRERGSVIIKVSDFISLSHLPMPNILMSAIDNEIRTHINRAVIVGLDSYLSLLDSEGITVFLTELQSRLDDNELSADYLLSARRCLNFLPRYEEARSIIFIDGSEEILEPLSILACSDKWVKSDIIGYKALLEQMSQYEPSGEYILILKNLTDKQAGIGSVVSFVLEIRDIAARFYNIDANLDKSTLELLLLKLAESGQSAENYLENLFGAENINTRLVLKRLLEIYHDGLWQAYIWLLRRRLRGDSYIAKVISGDIAQTDLLRKYAVSTIINILPNAHKYAIERAEALAAIGSDYESLIVEFIEQTKDINDALPFLNCNTVSERIEIVRRVSNEDLSYGLPKEYAEIYPTLAYYFSEFDYGDNTVTAYFKEYRRLKISNTITDDFIQLAYDSYPPKSYRSRDAILGELQNDTGLIVIDAMGAEYMPLLTALLKQRSINIESQSVATANLPTETNFNMIKWDKSRMLPKIMSVDNIVHDGAEKHENCTPERNFAETLRKLETEVMNRIAEGFTKFTRIVITADHGASRLAIIAHNKTLPWNGQPDNWRYSLAPHGIPRPNEFEQAYFPETKNTYWIVRGYNRLPKKGNKLHELHGGATLEERLVPIIVLTKDAAIEIPKEKKTIVDEFEGII